MTTVYIDWDAQEVYGMDDLIDLVNEDDQMQEIYNIDLDREKERFFNFLDKKDIHIPEQILELKGSEKNDLIKEYSQTYENNLFIDYILDNDNLVEFFFYSERQQEEVLEDFQDEYFNLTMEDVLWGLDCRDIED